jgi:hypothetical protein
VSGINRGKIALKIYKQLEKKDLLKEVSILRGGENVFKEKQEDLFVCKIKGYYHKGSSSGSNNIINASTDASNINKNYQDRFLIIVDETSLEIQERDYFAFDGVIYEIIDKGNTQDIVFDMYLKRME